MKNSGIPWIGEIPSHWETDNIGSLYSQRNEKVSDKDYPPLSVSKIGVVPQLETVAKTDDGDNRKLVRKGDFAINSRSDRRGSCGISAYDGSVSLINTILTPRSEMNPRFYDWLFHTSAFADEFYKWGHGIVDDLWTTRWAEMKRISIVVPPIPEQQAIADFLDNKCSDIDEMISLQERFIEELKAYKQSVITEAVCKGLNPDAPMKDSGIEWIGQIPKGWSVDKIVRAFDMIGSGTTPKSTDDTNFEGDIYWIQSGDINGSFLTSCKNRISNDTLERFSALKVYNAPFIIIAMYGASVGNACISQIDGCVNQACCVLKGNMLHLNYAFYAIKACKEFLLRKAVGGGQPNISQDTIKSTWLPYPPIEEQNEIADYLDEKCKEIDNLISIKQSKIEALKEYKKSIIYEFVTGKKEVV